MGYGNTEDIGDDEGAGAVGALDLGAPALQIATSTHHTCAVLSGGKVACWGLGEYGALGYGNVEAVGDDETPASVGFVDVGGEVVQVATGAQFTCVLLNDGGVKCWGANPSGELGQGNTEDIGDDEVPASIGLVGLGGVAIQVSARRSNACALLQAGEVRCWGSNEFGQLGLGHRNNVGDDEVPSEVAPIQLGGPAVQVSVGGAGFICSLGEGGSLYCWGAAGPARGVLNVAWEACYENTLPGASPCDVAPSCCIGDAAGEMPPMMVVYK